MHADGVDLDPALARVYGTPLPSMRITKLQGDASTRSYYRLALDGRAASPNAPRSLVAMRLPEDALGSDERTGAERPSELPFIDVQRMLARRGIAVPRVYADDTAGRVLLLEDLGDETFERRLARAPRERWSELYGRAVDLLARMHRACAGGEARECIAFRRRFEPSLLRWELDHFREWGLEALVGALPHAERAALDRDFDALTSRVAALPQGFVHRDYQSRNLMWARGDHASAGASQPSSNDERLTIIDFQDALQGPAVYDLVALLCDSYVALEPALQDVMIERYARDMALEPARVRSEFWLVAAQRKLKDAGRFVFIDRVRGNPGFLRWYPQSLRYAGRALREAGLLELRARIERYLPGFPDATAVPAATSAHG